MRNIFKVNRFWTFEQIGPRAEQMKRYLKQVNDEMFKQSMIRNVIGTAVSFPIHYFVDPVISLVILSGTALVQAHSIYKHRQLTQPLGYTQANKHLLLQELSQSQQMQGNITGTISDRASVGGGYKEYLKAQEQKRNLDTIQGQQSDLSSSQPQNETNTSQASSTQSQSIEYIQVETNDQRLKFYNRQLLCLGLLQGIFFGSYTELWEGDGDSDESGSILLLHLSVFMNSMLSGKLFSELYSQKYLNLTSSKVFALGTFLPLPLTMISPLLFNNGFLQQNLSKNAQMLFLKDNITEDPASFLMKRTGMRLFGLIMMYLMALANLEDKRNPQENKTFTISFITKRPKSDNDEDNEED